LDHNGRKLLNAIANPNKNIVLGDRGGVYLARLANVFRFPAEHGLKHEDHLRKGCLFVLFVCVADGCVLVFFLSRKEKVHCMKILVGYAAMDTRSMFRVVSTKTLACLTRLVDEDPFGCEVVALLKFLFFLRKYLNIFMSKSASLLERTESCAEVYTYLLIWRYWVLHTDGWTLAENFFSRETFIDVAVSCHAVVNSIRVPTTITLHPH
jgi:hypothetical protein